MNYYVVKETLLRNVLAVIEESTQFRRGSPAYEAVTAMLRNTLDKGPAKPFAYVYYEHEDHEPVFGHPDGYHPEDSIQLFRAPEEA